MPNIPNAAPMTLLLGIQDNSAAVPSVSRQEVPTHLAKIYLFAKKGPVGAQLVSPAGAVNMFGSDTFDERKKFATHQTVLSNVLSAAGSIQMIERVIPPDAGPKANFTLWLDVLHTNIPVYQRNTDGSYILDNITNLPKPVVPASTVSGYKVKWVITSNTAGSALSADGDLFGKELSKPGDQTDGVATSTRYPIFQFWASSPGSYANDAGFRLWAPTVTSSDAVNQKLMYSLKAYPYRLAAINRLTSNSTPTVKSTLSGDTSLEFVLEPGQINPFTDSQCSLADVFASAWQKLVNPGYDPVYADLGGFHVYQSYLDTVLGQFYSAEIAYITANTAASAGLDFSDNDSASKWMFNLLTGTSTSGVNYNTFIVNNDDPNSIALTESTNLFAAGGSDGTLSNANFNSLVATAVSGYTDPNSVLQDTAINVESIFYDTGFSLETKRALAGVISQRKDTFVVLSTYDVAGQEMGEADEAALGAALRTQLQLTPESVYFGTPVVRGLVMARYGKLIGHQYNGKLPLTIELAYKAARFMGAANGTWNPVYLFDTAPQNEVTMFTDLNVKSVPASQRNADWANGLNYPQPFSRDTFFFPALKTAFSDDTSVLTSFFTAMVCVELQKVGIQAWRNFSGVVSLTEAQLIDKVNKFVNENTAGRFAGLVRVIPNCTITSSDAQRGYSWTLPIEVYANNMKSVMTLSVQAYRMSALKTN